MEQVISDRNFHHLNQAQGTPLTIEPLLSLIGTDSYTSFSQELLNGKADLDHLMLSPTITKYLANLKQNKEIISTTTNKFIPLNQYKQGFKNPSGRHLGHHHSLLSPDGNQYNKNKEDFSDRIWNLHHSITSIALLNEKPLHRWLTSIVILLPKDPGRLQIHRLRIINTYESKYNLVLKYFWPKQGMKKVESNKWLGNNQTGRRKNFCAVETATIDQLIIKTHRLTKFPLCIHQDDAM